MDLYISPLSCSFAAHVACIEADVPVQLRRVDRRTKQLDDGRDFREVAPQAIVPALGLPDGSLLTETAAVLTYIADQAPARRLAPPADSFERYRLFEWINFVATEVHKKHLNPLFSRRTSAPVKEWALSGAAATLAHPARHLSARSYLVGEGFTVADAYLFWALLVAPQAGIALDPWPPLRDYVARIQARPSVARALAIEYPLYRSEQATAAGGA